MIVVQAKVQSVVVQVQEREMWPPLKDLNMYVRDTRSQLVGDDDVDVLNLLYAHVYDCMDLHWVVQQDTDVDVGV